MTDTGVPPAGVPSPIEFFSHLKWIDGRPLLDTIEPYRQKIFMAVLFTFTADGRLRYTMALAGRGKKNWKTADLCLAAIYRFLVWISPQGNDVFLVANDADQANDDLSLIKKIIAANPILDREVTVGAKSISRRDGKGTMQIVPANDVAGQHGKTFTFVGFDEIHAYKNHDLFEALAPDPTRSDAIVWVTSYASLIKDRGRPINDFMEAGKAGTDPKMFFSWYDGSFTTDLDFAELPPEQRANPSMASWDGDGYLDQQRARLPTHKFRRLHLNLGGAPEGAAFSPDHVLAAIMSGRKRLQYEPGRRFHAFVDMSGGSSDDAVLGIAHRDPDTKRSVLDMLASQAGAPPFNPRSAVKKFASLLDEYRLKTVAGDDYAGETFKADFAEHGIHFRSIGIAKSDLYENLEPKLNAAEVELLDIDKLQEQLLSLVWRGTKIDHGTGAHDHDDWANAAAGAIHLTAARQSMHISPEAVAASRIPGSWTRRRLIGQRHGALR